MDMDGTKIEVSRPNFWTRCRWAIEDFVDNNRKKIFVLALVSTTTVISSYFPDNPMAQGINLLLRGLAALAGAA